MSNLLQAADLISSEIENKKEEQKDLLSKAEHLEDQLTQLNASLTTLRNISGVNPTMVAKEEKKKPAQPKKEVDDIPF